MSFVAVAVIDDAGTAVRRSARSKTPAAAGFAEIVRRRVRVAELAFLRQLALGVGVPAIAFSLVATGCGSASNASSTPSTVASTRSGAILPLTVIDAPTPRFQLRGYDTRGTYPQVRDDDHELKATNAGLRKGVRVDQWGYAPSARRAVTFAARENHGIYQTKVDRRLISASTALVSALLPAIKLYPGGTEGQGWVAMTIRVPSGRPVSITDLFAHGAHSLPALAEAWKAQFRRSHPNLWGCVTKVPAEFRPSVYNYRFFALIPGGLAIGFWGPAACERLEATVPYSQLRPYLSKRGRRLIAGVRRPK